MTDADTQPMPLIPATAKYDKVFARVEAERTKLRHAAMAKWYEPYGRFIYGNEAIAARINEGLYALPVFWSER